LWTMATQGGHPPAKRRKLDADLPIRVVAAQYGRTLRGVDRPISPPLTERKNNGISETVPTPGWGFGDVPRAASPPAAADLAASSQPKAERDGKGVGSTKYVRAPVQLTRIEDLAPHQNVDAVGLRDILGDPMIKECWNFNYLHDINFVM
jgi:tyrosyl-DNA phosphodiesterase-1